MLCFVTKHTFRPWVFQAVDRKIRLEKQTDVDNCFHLHNILIAYSEHSLTILHQTNPQRIHRPRILKETHRIPCYAQTTGFPWRTNRTLCLQTQLEPNPSHA